MENDALQNIEKDDPLYEEAIVLIDLKNRNITSPLKLKKFLRNYAKVYSGDELRNGIATKIFLAANPVKFLDMCYTQIHDYLLLVNKFVGEGAHGIISMQGNVSPINLTVVPNWLKTPWHYDDEMEIKRNAVAKWMNDNQKSYFHGKVIMFKKYGFSGHPDVLRMRNTKTTGHLTKVPGSKNMYYDKNKLQH